MTETPAQALVREIRETNTPDKLRYARVRALTKQITNSIGEPKRASALSSEFRGAYMGLQLALLRSNDTALLDLYKQQCTRTVGKICKAAREQHRTM